MPVQCAEAPLAGLDYKQRSEFLSPYHHVKNRDWYYQKNYCNPVYLTKNGRGDFAIVTMQELDELRALKGLFGALEKGETSARERGWVSYEAAKEALGV